MHSWTASSLKPSSGSLKSLQKWPRETGLTLQCHCARVSKCRYMECVIHPSDHSDKRGACRDRPTCLRMSPSKHRGRRLRLLPLSTRALAKSWSARMDRE